MITKTRISLYILAVIIAKVMFAYEITSAPADFVLLGLIASVINELIEFRQPIIFFLPPTINKEEDEE